MNLEVPVAVNVAVRKLDLQTFVTANMHLCSCRFTSALIVLGYFCACKSRKQFYRGRSLFPLFFSFLCVLLLLLLLRHCSRLKSRTPVPSVLFCFVSPPVPVCFSVPCLLGQVFSVSICLPVSVSVVGACLPVSAFVFFYVCLFVSAVLCLCSCACPFLSVSVLMLICLSV